jgi:hypothetical protein
MANKNKRKGKRLEEIVADILRDAFKVDKKYIKRAGSSGVREEEKGDIDIIHPEIEKQFPFVIECKNNEKWKLRDLIGSGVVNKSNIFKQFIEQSLNELEDNDFGLIVFSKNYEDIYGLFYSYNKKTENMFKKIDSITENKIITKLDNYKIIVFQFEEFVFNWIKKRS